MESQTTELADASATSTTLVRKRTDNELMPPPPPAKRIKRPKQVLDEDSYTDALSRIIARDFFPGLLESEAQQEYLDALESNDDDWISNASRRLHRVMTPGRRRHRRTDDTPARRDSSVPPNGHAGQTPMGGAGETPASVASFSAASAYSAATSASRADDTLDVSSMSLVAFQTKYTSEDNESFYRLLDKQNQTKAERYAWLWTGNNLPSKQQIKQREVEAKLLKARGSLHDSGFKKDRLAIKDKDTRPAAPDQWKHQPNNEVFFAPDGVDDLPLETPAQRAQAESRAGPKTIVYANTRPPQPNLVRIQEDEAGSAAARAASPSLSEIRDALAGKRRACDQESGTGGGVETPRVNGYAFVDDQEPAPSVAGTAASASTYTIDLGPGDATPNPFKIGERGKREALHHRMVDRISQSKRTASRLGTSIGAGAGGREGERSATRRLGITPQTMAGNLTPAARKLWGKIDTAGRRASASPFGQARASAATPRPARGMAGATPKLRGQAGSKQGPK